MLAATVPASADDAADLLAKHIAFMGWRFGSPDFANITYVQTRTQADGKPYYRTVTKRIGTVYRSDHHDIKANTDSSDGFTGRIFWYSNENGMTVPIIGTTAKINLSHDLFFSEAVENLPWTISGERRIWNRLYKIVSVRPDSAENMDLLVDPETGAYGGVIIDPKGNNEETIRILSYADAAPGRNFVKTWQFDGSKNTHTISDIALSAAVTNDALHPQAPVAIWRFDNPAPFAIKMTDSRFIVKAEVNGVEGTFLLDTGASNIYLSGAFARRAGIAATGHLNVYSMSGTEQNDTGHVKTFEIGGNTLSNVVVYFGSAEIEHDAPDGLLGFDLFAHSFVTLDVENHLLRVQDPDTVDANAVEGVHLGIDLGGGIPTVPMTVQRKAATVEATIDTGTPREILISRDTVNKDGLRMTGGEVCGELDDMTIGPIVYEHVPACNEDMPEGQALIGFDFLKGLGKIYFDYSRAGMILTPKSTR